MTAFFSTTIYDLGNDKIKLNHPISVIVNETDEECLARWPETGIYGIGSTLSHSIDILKENIIGDLFDLKSRPQDSLGIMAINKLKVLNAYLRSIE